MHLSISSLYMFRASQCSSSGDRILLIHHLVWLVCVTDCLVCRSGGNCSSLLTGIPSSHRHRLIHTRWCINAIDLLMMNTVLFEKCREMKWISALKKRIRLIINKNRTEMHSQQNINPWFYLHVFRDAQEEIKIPSHLYFEVCVI